MRVTDDHVFFFTGQDMFSNHYRCENKFCLPKHERIGVSFKTVEHFMMFEKAMLFGDKAIAEEVLNVWHPQDAKKLGRAIKGFDEAMWVESREDIVYGGVYSKIVYNQDIRIAAIKHRLAGRRFVEASPFDQIWGIKMSEDHYLVDDESQWRGLNLLGKCWDKAVDDLISVCGGYDQVRKDFED